MKYGVSEIMLQIDAGGASFGILSEVLGAFPDRAKLGARLPGRVSPVLCRTRIL